ncbi:MAG TPA: TadE family protein [Gemmataceae bacterium]|nr:TadE family protein [Gemmataceae bacterium]
MEANSNTRKSNPRGPRAARREGASAVELAIVLPVLVLLAFGSVDFGRFAYHHIAVTNAARAGAEHAIMNPYTSAQEAAWASKVQQTARDEMVNQVGGNPSLLTTTTTVAIEQGGFRRVRVEATYSSFQTIVSWPGIPKTVPLRAAVVMRAIR